MNTPTPPSSTLIVGRGAQLTESDANLLFHDSYVMHIKTNMCASCACGERHSELFEVWAHPTKTRTSNLHVLRKVTGHVVLKDLEIVYIELPATPIPLCSECVNTFVHPNRSSTIGIASREAWAETLRRKYTPEPTPVKTGKIEPTLDQL